MLGPSSAHVEASARAPRQRHGRAVSWAAPPAAPEATKRGGNGETSAAARRGRPRRGTVRTATSTAHACPSKASSLGRHAHRPDGVHGVLQPMSRRSRRLWWPLRPGGAAQAWPVSPWHTPCQSKSARAPRHGRAMSWAAAPGRRGHQRRRERRDVGCSTPWTPWAVSLSSERRGLQ